MRHLSRRVKLKRCICAGSTCISLLFSLSVFVNIQLHMVVSMPNEYRYRVLSMPTRYECKYLQVLTGTSVYLHMYRTSVLEPSVRYCKLDAHRQKTRQKYPDSTACRALIGPGKQGPTDPRALPSASRRIGEAGAVIGRSEKQNSSFDLFLSVHFELEGTAVKTR